MTKPIITGAVPISEIAKIERRKRQNWGFIKYMQKGESFSVETQRQAQNAYHAGRNRGFTMRIRQTPDGGYRVWKL